MSLVPVYVLADDGHVYNDPTLYSHDWFLCFDDDDPPELIVRTWPKWSVNDAHRRALQIIGHYGINGEIIRRGHSSHRSFPPNEELKLAQSFWLRINGPIPARHMQRQQPKQKRPQQGVFYLFGRTMDEVFRE